MRLSIPICLMVSTAEKQFSKMLELMISSPTWTLKPWKQVMETQLSSWTMYIPGVSSAPEVKEITKLKGIFIELYIRSQLSLFISLLLLF